MEVTSYSSYPIPTLKSQPSAQGHTSQQPRDDDSVTISAEAVQQADTLREPIEKVGSGTTPSP